jgi:phosphate:Na+ symporter
VFNCIGTVVFMIILSIMQSMNVFGESFWNMTVNSNVIAIFQTAFNLFTAVMLIPFTNQLVAIACRLVKDDPDEEDKYPELAALDEKLMISPAVALAEVERTLTVMARAAKENVELSLAQLKNYDPKVTATINRYEERLDSFADQADNYLIRLSSHIETERDNRHLSVLMQCVPDVERIGDYATNFDEMAMKLYESGLEFSGSAREELDILGDAVTEILRLTVEALETDSDQVARRIEPLEEVIDDMVLLLKNRHTDRLCRGVCAIDTGLVFQDLLTHLERTADQCSSIAMMLMSKRNEEILKAHHHYIHELHATADQSYLAEDKMRRAQFLAPLEKIVG